MHFIFYFTFFIFNIFYQSNETKSKWFIKDSVLIEVNQNSIINYNSINYDTILRVPLINKDKINLNDFDLLNYDEVYFYKKTGGILYKLINNELIRIDNSYDHKLHKYSLKFFHQNKINIYHCRKYRLIVPSKYPKIISNLRPVSKHNVRK